MPETISVLVIDDEKEIADLVEIYLVSDGYKVFKANNALEGQWVLERNQIHLVLLDIMMPGMDGLSMCKKIRETSNIPIILISAKSADLDKILGLGTGADDYVTKPFRLRELMARISAVLRRSGGTDTQSQANTPSGADTGVIAAGHGIRIHTRQARVTLRSAEVELTALEYRLLLTFAGSPGQVLTRTRLLEGIWDVGGSFVNDNTLSVYVGRLREKLGDDSGNPRIIQTVRGLGYRLATEGTGEYT